MFNKKNKSSNQVVQPTIRSNDERHILEDIFEGPYDEMPEIKSVGYARIGKGANNWVSYVITTKGDKVLKVEAEEPNLREIAEESAKISFVQSFVDQELF